MQCIFAVMGIQQILVIIIVVAATYYLVRKIKGNMKHDDSHSGCDKCDVAKENKKAPP